MVWALSNESQRCPIASIYKGNKRKNNPEKSATKTVNTTEDIDNGNDEYSENLIYKFLLKTILIKTLMVYDKDKVTKQPWKHIYDVNENNNLNNKMWCFQQSLYQNVQNI